MKKNSKKKGFTLIELIAVIAILGILAAVLIPNIIGYTDKAKVKSAQTNAKLVLSAIESYNADTTATELNKYSAVDALSDATYKIKNKVDPTLADLTRIQLTNVANGYDAGSNTATVVQTTTVLSVDNAKLYVDGK